MASLSAVTVVLPCPCKHIALLHWWLLTGLVDSSIIAGPVVTMFGTYSMGQAAFSSGRGRFLQRILCQFPATQPQEGEGSGSSTQVRPLLLMRLVYWEVLLGGI
jgi:hypothetical protein